MKTIKEQKPDYLAYLLRLWRTGGDEEPTWRATLECARTHEQVGFESIAALCHYLQRQTDGIAHETIDDHRI